MVRPATDFEDVVLVDRFLSGQQRAAQELFRLHHARVHATLYRVLGSNRDIDDLLQETFIQVFRSLRGFRGDARLSTWIDRIAARVAYRYLRRRKLTTLTTELAEDQLAAGGSPQGSALAREGIRRLYAILAELSPKSRLAFALSDIDGRSLAEVAAAMGSSHAATKLRVWRARKHVRKQAEKDPVLAEFVGAECMRQVGE